MIESLYPQTLAAICIWREARGESFDAKRAVAWVLKNRAEHGRWGDLVSVVTAPYQFSSFNSTDVNVTKFPAADDPAWLECCRAVEDPGNDPTDGAMFYHSFADRSRFPKWADESKLTAHIGAFRFYRL